MTDGAAISHLGSSRFKNLYTSAVDLNAAGFITEGYRKKALLNPPLSPLSQRRECFTLKEGDQQPENYMDRRYVVDDDLLIHQASAMSVAKHWCRREKANVMEMDITMGKHEAVVLLQAMLTSKTVLTDVFVDRLEAFLPPEEPQGVRP